MNHRLMTGLLSASALWSGFAWSQEAPSVGALQSSNLLNPNLSVVGWFQGQAGHPHPGAGQEAEPPLQLKETEIGFQAVVDPYARGDFFVSFNQDGNANLEEGYLTWFHLPYNTGVRVGKFRSNFGAFNRTHPHDTPFATRPLSEQNYFGDGLNGAGAGLSWQVPNPWLFINFDAEVLRPPAATDAPAFDRAERSDLLYTGRASAYYDLTEAVNVMWGGSFAYGPSGQQFTAVTNSSQTLRSQIYSADLTFRWKNPRRSIYRSLIWQTQALWDRRESAFAADVFSRGWFSYLEYQFARRWRTGIRYDYSDIPANSAQHEEGKLVYLTFVASEFSRLSLQASHVKRADGGNEDLGFFRVIFNIGPHGAHPF